MKKIGALLMLILFSFALVSSQISDANDTSDTPGNAPATSDANIQKNAGEIKEKINAFPEKPIEIPEKLRTPAKIFLKIEDGDPLNLLVISLMLAILFFFMYMGMMESFSPFSHGPLYGISFALVIISAAIGIIRWAASTLISFSKIFSFAEKWPFLQFVVLIIILMILWIPISKLLRVLGYRNEKTEAEIAAMKRNVKEKASEHNYWDDKSIGS